MPLIMMGTTWMFLISLALGRNHLLSTLLNLEGIMLILFGTFSFLSGMWTHMFIFNLMFLTLTACEGALGLSLLVLIVRWWGEDRVLSLNMLPG